MDCPPVSESNEAAARAFLHAALLASVAAVEAGPAHASENPEDAYVEAFLAQQQATLREALDALQ